MKIRRTLATRLLALCSLMMITVMAKARSRPIYDVNANARHDIAAAIQKASKNGRNVVLIFGANW